PALRTASGRPVFTDLVQPPLKSCAERSDCTIAPAFGPRMGSPGWRHQEKGYFQMKNLHIEVWPLEKLVPYAKAARKNDHAVQRMMALIEDFGFKLPLLIRGSGEIVDGHLRWKAAQKLNLAEVPVIRCDDWTEAQV